MEEHELREMVDKEYDEMVESLKFSLGIFGVGGSTTREDLRGAFELYAKLNQLLGIVRVYNAFFEDSDMKEKEENARATSRNIANSFTRIIFKK